MIVVDTGPIVAAAFKDDDDHEQCVATFTSLRKARRPLLVPTFVAGEACYMLSRLGGAEAEGSFLRSLESGWFTLTCPTKDDLARMATLVERYSNLPLGAADASVVAVAERMGISEVFTIDTRDFSVVRPSHVARFILLPE